MFCISLNGGRNLVEPAFKNGFQELFSFLIRTGSQCLKGTIPFLQGRPDEIAFRIYGIKDLHHTLVVQIQPVLADDLAQLSPVRMIAMQTVNNRQNCLPAPAERTLT